ncbi:transglutaminaseTgpA domain-containing protein, partial [Candidatus Riflebacteria bacterium]
MKRNIIKQIILIQSWLTIRLGNALLLFDLFILLTFFLPPHSDEKDNELLTFLQNILVFLSVIISIFYFQNQGITPLPILGYFFLGSIILYTKREPELNPLYLTNILIISLLIPAQSETGLNVFIIFCINLALFVISPLFFRFTESRKVILKPGILIKATIFCLGAFFCLCSLSWICFFVMPRPEGGFLGQQEDAPISGFATRVSISGGDGSIFSNPEPVLRVKGTAPMYFRGMSFDYFNGHTWERRISGRKIIYAKDRVKSFLNEFQFSRVHLKNRKSCMIEYLNLGLPVLFVPQIPIQVKFSGEDLLIDFEKVIMKKRSARGIWGRYHFDYFPNSYRFPIRSKYNFPLFRLSRFYLQLPHTISPEIIMLARRITKNKKTAPEKWQALSRFLRKNFLYTLALPGYSHRPLDNFLFNTKKGHCEFFATALTVLCRAVGLPARIVNGFSGGDYNPIGNYTIIRQSHAHAWTEVYSPARGWVTIDATPAQYAEEAQISRSARGWWTFLYDYLDIFWIENFVNLSRDSRLLLFEDLLKSFALKKEMGTSPAEIEGSNWFSTSSIRKLIYLSLFLSMLLLFFIRNYFRQRKMTDFFGIPPEVNIEIIKIGEILGLFEKINLNKSPYESLRQFFFRVAPALDCELHSKHFNYLNLVEKYCYSNENSPPGRGEISAYFKS